MTNEQITGMELCKKSTADYLKIFENSSLGNAILRVHYDAAGKPSDFEFVDVNPAFSLHTGIKAQSLIGELASGLPELFSSGLLPVLGRVAFTSRPQRYDQYFTALSRFFDCWVYCLEPDMVAVSLIDITETKQSEKLQSILYTISKAMIGAAGILELMETIREQTHAIFDCTHLSLAFADKTAGVFRQTFPVDQQGKVQSWPLPKSLHARVIQRSRPMLLTHAMIVQLLLEAEIEIEGQVPVAWMGVPVIIGGSPFGVLSVSGYVNMQIYTPRHLEILAFIAQQIGVFVDKANYETELRQSQAALLELNMHLEDIMEEERKAIATNLHDDLGQKLTALIMDLSWIRRNREAGDEVIGVKMDSMKSLLDESISTVRRISSDLRPAAIDDLGLVAALSNHILKFEANTGIKCHTRWPLQDIDMDPKLAITIFRIVQESLTNVARHARASLVRVSLTCRKGYLRIEVRDNGVGISPDKLSGNNSFGLMGMHERVASWGGKLKITGQESKGTRLFVNLPLTKPEKL